MASLPVYDQAGKKVGSYDIEPTDLCATIDKQLLHDAVVMYQANARQGSFKTKTRSEVSGTTKKMYRQKGTGNARAGHRTSNIRRGGGHAFAIRNRDYSYRLPRKAVRLATRMAIAGKIQDDRVLVVDQLALDAPKTSTIAKMLKGMGLEGRTALIATADVAPAVHKSARNIGGVSVLPVSDLNALAILKPQRMIVTREAMDRLKENAAKPQEKASA